VSKLASNSYEVIIIGGGPAGLTAGLYTARARISSLLIEKGVFGGQMVNAEELDNYPGFPEGISGFELAELMFKQATKYGLKTIITEVTGPKLKGKERVVETTGGTFTAKAVVIAGGSNRRKLSVPGEEQFTGKGVSYCATCDAAFFRGLPIASRWRQLSNCGSLAPGEVCLQGHRNTPPQPTARRPYSAGKSLRRTQNRLPVGECGGEDWG